MTVIKKLTTIFAVLFVLASSNAFADDSEKLFVNLTSDEMNRATMAIELSTQVLKQKNIPVTIWLTVEGVRIADTTIPEHSHANGKSLKAMLSDFMTEGGKVIMCGMCMTNVAGMKKDEVLDGIQFSGGMDALLDDDATVLTY